MVAQGTTLAGRYRLDVRLGAGGMGEVWRGEDTVLARTVAVKVLLPGRMDDPGFAARFQGEARAMATINHPGVVDVYDYGVSDVPGDGPTAYLVMRFVDGEPLDRLLTRLGRIAPEPAMELIAQAAAALQAVHDKGIVHRDVKPGNLLVRPDGTLVLTDFGIARADMGHRLTDAGMVLGTAAYCAPEQAEGQPVTPAVDIYALGVVAYECLAGYRPFDGDTPVTIALKHIREEPPPLPPDVPPSVRHLVERALVKDPARRWHSAAEMSMASRQTMRDDTGPSSAVFGVAGLTGMVSSEQTTSAGAHPGHGPAGVPETGAHAARPAWHEGDPGATAATPQPYIMGASGSLGPAAHAPPMTPSRGFSTSQGPAADPTAASGPRGARGGRRGVRSKRRGPGLLVGVIAAGALLGGGGALAFNQLANTGAQAAGVVVTPSATPGESEPPPKRGTQRSPRPTPVQRPETEPVRRTEEASPSPSPTGAKPSPTPTRSPSPSPSPTPSKSPTAKRVVPAVINMSEDQARAKLKQAGFKAKVDLSGEPSGEGCTRVLDQSPTPGTSLGIGQAVTIVVQQGIPCDEPGDGETPTPSPTLP
ncbi:serine/threonine-protein kinase [Sphaerisporangium sp. TRM90804]|uniref:serine/threonine-protein kinase n=1 Tax=Sphaerisporangium sp. TRM90804 TaxID=3031113 RepID=UPI002449517E|nr:serine/threonine-protein kinase [Sphaerisporangium sp. TRM90804]MDH2427784.1 protein kinase [Sphaerisporangium sp. TRM90804]